MTLPMNPNQKLGESEMSWGSGMFPHPDSVASSKKTPFPEADPIDQDFREAVAIRRSDPTVADETVRDLMFVKGNPDRFGGQPALVQESANVPLPVPENKTVKDRVERAD